MHDLLTARPASTADAHTLSFIDDLVAGAVPSILVPTPAPDAAMHDCVNLVNQAVEREGGKRVDGWALWEWPRVFLEAEYHCVWRTPSNELCDLSPLPQGILHRLFVIDPNLSYEDRQINNVRQALSEHRAIHELIDAYDAYFEMMNRGDRANQHGAINIPPEESVPVNQRILAAKVAVDSWLAGRGGKIGRNESCPCGSGLKYKRCHEGQALGLDFRQ